MLSDTLPSAAPMLAPTWAPTLALRPPAEACAYAAALTWESYVNGAYQHATVHKQLTLRAEPNAAGYAVEICSLPPVLATPADPEALAQLAGRLAALYARVLVQAAPTGEVVALLNHAEVLETWARLAPALRAATTEDDQVTTTLLAFVDRQLQTPAGFLRSLDHDYLYQALLPALYNQPLGRADHPGRPRRFAHFFDKVALCFSEHVRVEPGEAPEPLTLRLHGTLDAQTTDVAAIERRIAKEFQTSSPAGTPVPAVIPPPRFQYEATYVVARDTGLPQRVALNVSARAGLLYNKEYTLALAPA